MITAMTLLTIILTVSVVLAGFYAVLLRTGREQLRFVKHRLRLAVAEMNYASRRMVELQSPRF